MLIGLVTASRTIENEYTFSCNTIHKGKRKGNSPAVRLYAYPDHSASCVVKCLDEYLQRSLKNKNRQKRKSC